MDRIEKIWIMEPLSKALFICAVTMALYQMSGTPFLLNIIIFCSCTLLSLYALFVTGYLIPSESLHDWFFEGDQRNHSKPPTRDKKVTPGFSLAGPFHSTDDQITKRLREITGHIVRDFILSWYNTVSEDVCFVQESFEIFEHLLQGARTRVSKVKRDTLLARIISRIRAHHIAYQSASCSPGDRRNKSAISEEDASREEQLRCITYFSTLAHPALEDLPDSEMEYLRGLVVLLLKALLPTSYVLNRTSLYIVRELIAQNVLNAVVNLISDPLWIYNTIPKVLEDEDEEEEGRADNGGQTEQEIESSFHDPAQVATTRSTSETPAVEPQGDSSVTCNATDNASEEDLSKSQTTSTSFSSQASLENTESILLSSCEVDEDIPLPMTSSLMHFAPEDSEATSAPSDEMMSPSTSPGVVVVSPRNSISGQSDRLFQKIRIPESITMQESFDGGGKYTLYRITYKTMERAQPDSEPSKQENSGYQPAVDDDGRVTDDVRDEFRPVKHQVQRRFREFLVLQERLSQNMVAKSLLVDIKGPSRMFPVPFGNMDKEYIEQRRKFLQAYLREICSFSYVSRAREVREFMAYESDPRIAYVRKPDPLPRIDKIFRSAIHDLFFGSTTMKFSATLHTDEEDDADLQVLRKQQEKDGEDSVDAGTSPKSGPVAKLRSIVLGSPPKPARLEDAERKFTDFVASGSTIPEHWMEQKEVHRSSPHRDALGMQFCTRTSGDGADSEVTKTEVRNEAPEESQQISAVDSIFRLMQSVWRLKPGSHNLLVLSLNKFLERYVSNKADKLTSVESWTRYLEVLRDALWPNGVWDSNEEEKIVWTNAATEVKEEAKRQSQEALEKAFPDILKKLVGEQEYSIGVAKLIDSFENPVINRHLAYTLLDVLVLELFPDLDNVVAFSNVSFDSGN